MPPAPAIGDAAEPFTLDDQYGTAHRIEFGNGTRATVLLFADRGCMDSVRPWVERLVGDFGERVRVLGIAAVGVVPSLFHGVVRGLLQGQPSVLIDWDDRVSHRFGYDGGRCLLVVVDASGRVSERVTGPLSDPRYAQVAAAIGPSV